MPVPKKRTSAARRDARRSHLNIPLPNAVKERQTGLAKRRHFICPEGFYKGKQIFVIKKAK